MRFLQSEFSDENTEEPDIEDDTRWLPLDQYFVGISTSKLKHGILVKRITNSGVYRFLKAICRFYWDFICSFQYFVKKMNMNSPTDDF